MTGQGDDGVLTSRPVRKFAVEPVETTVSSNRSSRKKVANATGQSDSHTTNTRPIRRFAVEPVETTTSSNRDSKESAAGSSARKQTPPKRRFLPQPEETSTRSNRKLRASAARDSDTDGEKQSTTSSSISKRGPNGERQFVPQLIGTARRSRKIGDETSVLQPADKTDSSPGDRTYQPRHIRLSRPLLNAPVNSPTHSLEHVPQISESRFSYASLSSKRPEKRKSFRIPALESITSTGDSDDSENSNPPSLSTSPSAASEEVDIQRKVRVLHKESRDEQDEKISGYILSLAATAAKKQLQEQALAAFPNERQYQPVNHFAIDDESAGSDEEEDGADFGQLDDPDFFQRRMSSAGWDLLEMQKHKEMLEEQRRQRRLRDEESRRKKSELDPFSNPYDLGTLRIARIGIQGDPKSTLGGALRDSGEVTKMRHAASPPMLGGDMAFPKSVSPQHTMMDPTQRPVCWKHGKPSGVRSRQNSGLWIPHGSSPMATRKSTATSRHNVETSSSPGLWGGFCKAPDHNESLSIITPHKSKFQSGLMTPSNERADPFSPTSTPISTPYHQLPITPDLNPTSDVNLEGIDSVLQLEATIDTEYPDSFVTQVYNYLSLGYPALARDYDFELSKISRVPVEEIRRSDSRADSKGHIGAPEGEGSWDEKQCTEECGRWTALRLYIREWARQQPKFIDENAEARKAARARRGSWGV